MVSCHIVELFVLLLKNNLVMAATEAVIVVADGREGLVPEMEAGVKPAAVEEWATKA